jgi:hypothetical protein
MKDEGRIKKFILHPSSFREVAVMGAFRRVEGKQAGPTALGVLVPPSRRTVLILRPRTLAWDLVLAQPGGSFREMNCEEAEHIAHQIAASLETVGGGPIEAVYSLDQGGSWLRVRIGPYALTVCGRVPGQPYQPHLFPNAEAVRSATVALTALLRPAPDGEQELYVNTRNFTRPN